MVKFLLASIWTDFLIVQLTLEIFWFFGQPLKFVVCLPEQFMHCIWEGSVIVHSFELCFPAYLTVTETNLQLNDEWLNHCVMPLNLYGSILTRNPRSSLVLKIWGKLSLAKRFKRKMGRGNFKRKPFNWVTIWTLKPWLHNLVLISKIACPEGGP